MYFISHVLLTFAVRHFVLVNRISAECVEWLLICSVVRKQHHSRSKSLFTSPSNCTLPAVGTQEQHPLRHLLSRRHLRTHLSLFPFPILYLSYPCLFLSLCGIR